MTAGRVEVYHDDDFLQKKTVRGAGALVARFTCTTEKFAQSEAFIRFCKQTCFALYEAEGEITNLTGTFARGMAQEIQFFKKEFDEEVHITDIEYIVL